MMDMIRLQSHGLWDPMTPFTSMHGERPASIRSPMPLATRLARAAPNIGARRAARRSSAIGSGRTFASGRFPIATRNASATRLSDTFV